jgi:hypothetical protein
MMPTIASIIDEEVNKFEDLYKNLGEARKKPHVMDDQIWTRPLIITEIPGWSMGL